MADVPKTIKQWQMVQPTVFNKETKETTPGKLAIAEIPVPELKEGEVLVEIAGCGVCHSGGRAFSGQRQACIAADGLAHALCHGTA